MEMLMKMLRRALARNASCGPWIHLCFLNSAAVSFFCRLLIIFLRTSPAQVLIHVMAWVISIFAACFGGLHGIRLGCYCNFSLPDQRQNRFSEIDHLFELRPSGKDELRYSNGLVFENGGCNLFGRSDQRDR